MSMSIQCIFILNLLDLRLHLEVQIHILNFKLLAQHKITINNKIQYFLSH